MGQGASPSGRGQGASLSGRGQGLRCRVKGKAPCPTAKWSCPTAKSSCPIAKPPCPTAKSPSALRPSPVGYDARAFANGDELVRRNAGNHFARPARPEDLDVHGRDLAEAEMQARIVRGIEARLADDGLGFGPIAGMDEHARADRAAVRLHPLELHLDPVPAAGHVVAEQ